MPDHDYWTRRIEEERDAASRARDPDIRDIHLELAALLASRHDIGSSAINR